MDCAPGEHRYFVAEVIGVESLGRVVLIKTCTACDKTLFQEHQVGTPGEPIRLLKEEKGNKT